MDFCLQIIAFVANTNAPLQNGEGEISLGEVKFCGTVINGIPNGRGCITSSNYQVCTNFVNGLPSGLTSIIWSGDNCKLSYEGGMQRGIYEGFGRLKIYDLENGNDLLIGIYNGTFKDGQFCGYGKLKQTDGTLFNGDFFNGKVHGNCIFTPSNGSPAYEGTWKEGLQHGSCVEKHKDGEIYDLTFDEGNLVGRHLRVAITTTEPSPQQGL